MPTFKNPKELSNSIQNDDVFERTYGSKIKTPLDDFKNFESHLVTGPDFYGEREHYGTPLEGLGSQFQTPYPKLIEAYSKSKGKYANAALTDPEIKKYHNSRMAERNALYDRVRKVPQDKWKDFAYGYGSFADPFDFEGDPEDVMSVDDFLNSFDVSYGDWDTLSDYLKKKGY